MAGIFQAQKERMDSTRYKMRWENKSADDCMLSFEQSSQIIQPASGKLNSLSPGILTLSRLNSDWKMMAVIFCYRVGCLYAATTRKLDLLQIFLMTNAIAGLVLTMDFLLVIASKKLFIAGQEIFWQMQMVGKRIVLLILGQSTLNSKYCRNDRFKGGRSSKFNELRNPALSIGCLAGAWERCEGRPVKVLPISDQKHVITLQSKYEMSQIGD